MKILICGAAGQLGSDLQIVLANQSDIVAADRSMLDISNYTEAESAIKSIKPDTIINCAAYNKVDACESKKKEAYFANVIGAMNLSILSNKFSSKLIQISTDYVFDGNKELPNPYNEEDETNPISYYGKTKLDGEVEVRNNCKNHIIIRTAWLYGIKGHNFLKTMLKIANANPSRNIKVVNDQYGSPTWTYRLALQINELIGTDITGTVHATSEGHCTWYELSKTFLDDMGYKDLVIPCTSKEYPTPASRPINSILENSVLKKHGLNLMKNWKLDLGEFTSKFKQELLSGLNN